MLELTSLKGVGPVVAERLRAAGYPDVMALALAFPQGEGGMPGGMPPGHPPMGEAQPADLDTSHGVAKVTIHWRRCRSKTRTRFIPISFTSYVSPCAACGRC